MFSGDTFYIFAHIKLLENLGDLSGTKFTSFHKLFYSLKLIFILLLNCTNFGGAYRLGFEVTGIDKSKVGIEQMNRVAKTENLLLTGFVTDIFQFEDFTNFDFVLLDSMFHFEKKDRKKETDFIKTIISKIKSGCLIVFCIQETGKKVEILNEIIDFENRLERLADKKFVYLFEDKDSGHKSKSDYRLLIVKK
jgi:hypothetical protein